MQNLCLAFMQRWFFTFPQFLAHLRFHFLFLFFNSFVIFLHWSGLDPPRDVYQLLECSLDLFLISLSVNLVLNLFLRSSLGVSGYPFANRCLAFTVALNLLFLLIFFLRYLSFFSSYSSSSKSSSFYSSICPYISIRTPLPLLPLLSYLTSNVAPPVTLSRPSHCNRSSFYDGVEGKRVRRL